MAVEREDGRLYKLFYFEGIRGRAEATRIMFSLADVEFEDVEISFEDWPRQKPVMPLGQMPVLETEQGTIVQTTAIQMFVAERHGFLPESDWDRAVCNSIMISLNEMSTSAVNVIGYTVYKLREYPGDEVIEENKKKSLDLINKTLHYIEKHAAKNAAKFIFSDKMTVADAALYTAVEYCSVVFPDLRERNDWLKQWVSNMEGDNKFAAYLKDRKPSLFGT